MASTNILLNGLKGKERQDMEDAILRASAFLKVVSKRIEDELNQ